MDPRMTKALVALAAIGLYAWMGGIPPTFEQFMQQLSLVLLGGVTLRRPGDLGPIYEDVP